MDLENLCGYIFIIKNNERIYTGDLIDGNKLIYKFFIKMT